MNFRTDKAVQVLNYFASLDGTRRINKMKALKLIWLSDRLHLRKYGRTIINDNYKAMPNGPVASLTRDILEKEIVQNNSYAGEYLTADPKDRYYYYSNNDVDWNVFSKTDLECMEIISKTYGALDKFELSGLSHQYPEWKRYEHNLRNGDGRSFDIVIDDFFKNENKDTSIFNQSKEHLNLSYEMFTGLNY